MPTDFPGGVDDIQNDVTNSTVLMDVHPSLHNDLADAIMAIETQVLAGGGTVADGSITSAKIADGTIVAGDLADGAVTSAKILDGTIVAGDLADGAVTSAKILDGTIATADHADASVTNAKLASDTARANLLTNGGFEVWQRGNGPFSANAGYSADRWVLSIGGGSSLSISRQAGNASAYAASFSYTHSGASQLIQKVEVGGLLGQTVTFALDVFTASANAVRVLVWDALGGLNYSSYHTGNSTWQRLSSTLAVSASATQLQVYAEFAASSGGALDNAMLVVGSVAADYAPLHPADDLARCKRYYEAFAIGNGGTFFTGTIYGANNAKGVWNWKVGKAVTPSLTFNAANSYVIYAAGTSHICSAVVSHGGNLDQAELNFTTAGAPTVGQASLITANNPAGMYCEANP